MAQSLSNQSRSSALRPVTAATDEDVPDSDRVNSIQSGWRRGGGESSFGPTKTREERELLMVPCEVVKWWFDVITKRKTVNLLLLLHSLAGQLNKCSSASRAAGVDLVS